MGWSPTYVGVEKKSSSLHPMRAEIIFIQEVQSWFQTPLGAWFVVLCARWMIFFFAPLAAATSLRSRRSSVRHAAYEAAWAGLVAMVTASVLGVLIGRIRPFSASDQVVLLIPPPASLHSFPSIHTSIAFAIVAALAYGDRRLGAIAFLMALLVAFGRVASGVHYPSDIVAGVIVGLLSFWFVRHMHHVLRRRPSERPSVQE